MTDLVRLRKVGILCAAASLAFGLNACDSRNLSESFAAIKAIRVDDSADPNADQDHKKLDAHDLKLVVDTAKALTVDKGGLLAQKSRAVNGTCRDNFRCIRCARMLIMVSRKPTPLSG